MRFGNAHYLPYILLAIAAVAGLYAWYLLWKSRVMKIIAAGAPPGALVKRHGIAEWVGHVMVFTSIILCGIILLRPQWGERLRQVSNEGADVLIALDVSPSMLARDAGGVSRLERAKDAIRWIVDSLKGDRVGLILFSGDAFLQCPLTNDYGAFMMFLDAAGPDSINLKGTDIGAALREAYRVFTTRRLTSRLLVLITDGEDHEGSAEDAAARFREMDVSIYAVGVGSSSGEVIPVSDKEKEADAYLRDSEGRLVKTRKDSSFLKKLAGLTRGSYIDITEGFSGLRFILDIIEDQEKTRFGTRIIKEPREQYQIFAVVLCLILIASVIVPGRRE